jgi:hypothetical protein
LDGVVGEARIAGDACAHASHVALLSMRDVARFDA